MLQIPNCLPKLVCQTLMQWWKILQRPFGIQIRIHGSESTVIKKMSNKQNIMLTNKCIWNLTLKFPLLLDFHIITSSALILSNLEKRQQSISNKMASMHLFFTHIQNPQWSFWFMKRIHLMHHSSIPNNWNKLAIYVSAIFLPSTYNSNTINVKKILIPNLKMCLLKYDETMPISTPLFRKRKHRFCAIWSAESNGWMNEFRLSIA